MIILTFKITFSAVKVVISLLLFLLCFPCLAVAFYFFYKWVQRNEELRRAGEGQILISEENLSEIEIEEEDFEF